MGRIVAAMATSHAPQLFTRPPTEDLRQLDADVAAMQSLGDTLEQTRPDLAIVIGCDHLETFGLSCVPTFALVTGARTQAAFAGRRYDLPAPQGFTDALLHELIAAGFDLTCVSDVVLGHAFAAVYEWVIGGRTIPVVPILTNVYVPPLPSAKRCHALGRAIASIVDARPERVAIIASGGMSHYPGTWKYAQPAFEFDRWAIAQMELGRHDSLVALSNEQLDEVGNTELLPWMTLFGAIGNTPGELLTYQPTWHHGHAVMRFIPQRLDPPAPAGDLPDTFTFSNGAGPRFYERPPSSAARLNAVLEALRHDAQLRRRLLADTAAVAAEYGLDADEARALETLKRDDLIEMLRSATPHPLVERGAHPLAMLMSLMAVQEEIRRSRN